MAGLVKFGDMALLQSDNQTNRETDTGKQLVGLVATVAAGGATPEVIEVISTIVGNLQTGALAKIKEDHSDAQTKINTDLEDLRNMTEAAVHQWRVAAEHDTEWLACVTEEHALLQSVEACRATEEVLLQDKAAKCDLTGVSSFQDSSSRPDLSFSCEFGKDECVARLSHLKQNFDLWFAALGNEVERKKQAYDA